MPGTVFNVLPTFFLTLGILLSPLKFFFYLLKDLVYLLCLVWLSGLSADLPTKVAGLVLGRHMPRLWARSSVRGGVRGNHGYFSHIDVSLPLFLAPFCSP